MSRQYVERFESRLAQIAQNIGLANAAGHGGNQDEVNRVVDFLLDGKLRPPVQPISPITRTDAPTIYKGEYYLLWEGSPVSRPSSDPLKVYANADIAKNLLITHRQLDAAACLVSYDTDIKSVAERLIVSRHTARNFLVALYDKLGVRSQTLAAVTSLRTGLLRVTDASK